MAGRSVLLVHGLWMTGLELVPLRERLTEAGHTVRIFSYPTLTGTLDENRRRLRDAILAANRTLDIIGHSLGGVLALQTLKNWPGLPVHRVVCLGSPLVDTAAARALQRLELARLVLGETLPEAVFEQPLRRWSGPQAVGVIAGTLSYGPGNLITDLPQPNDGTVALVETWLPGITDHLALPVGHATMLISDDVAAQCDWFLRHGRFRRREAPPAGQNPAGSPDR